MFQKVIANIAALSFVGSHFVTSGSWFWFV